MNIKKQIQARGKSFRSAQGSTPRPLKAGGPAPLGNPTCTATPTQTFSDDAAVLKAYREWSDRITATERAVIDRAIHDVLKTGSYELAIQRICKSLGIS